MMLNIRLDYLSTNTAIHHWILRLTSLCNLSPELATHNLTWRLIIRLGDSLSDFATHYQTWWLMIRSLRSHLPVYSFNDSTSTTTPYLIDLTTNKNSNVLQGMCINNNPKTTYGAKTRGNQNLTNRTTPPEQLYVHVLTSIDIQLFSILDYRIFFRKFKNVNMPACQVFW